MNVLEFYLKFGISRIGHLPLVEYCIPDRYELYDCSGRKIYLNLRESHMMTDRILGIYEYQKMELMGKCIHKGQTVIDIGANKGDFTLLFAYLVGGKGKVLSFEPDGDNYKWLCKSIQVNGYDYIKAFKVALADKNGHVKFYRGKKSGWGSTRYSQKESASEQPITVKCLRLDDVITDNKIQNVDVIKIDVQGAELSVLKGSKKVLKNNNVKLAIDVDSQDSYGKEELLNFLNSLGYTIYSIGTKLTQIKVIGMGIREIYAERHIR